MIKKYIEFAIKNGYVFPDFVTMDNIKVYEDENMIMLCLIEEGEQLCDFNTIETITSKPFIEAIARGIEYKFPNYTNGKHDTYGWSEEDRITFYQVIAIRENELDDYITKLLKG